MKIVSIPTPNELEYYRINSFENKITLTGKVGVSSIETEWISSEACRSIDIELVLSKVRQTGLNLEIEVVDKRKENEISNVFTERYLQHKSDGIFNQKKAEAAVKCVENYCSVLTRNLIFLSNN